jgi:hypothetical protein
MPADVERISVVEDRARRQPVPDSFDRLFSRTAKPAV